MKRFLTLFLVIVLVLSLCACGNNSSEDATKALVEETEHTEPSHTVDETEAFEQEIQAISLGESIQTNNFTMTFDSMEILAEFEYNTSEYSSISLYVEDGYKLLLVRGHMENTGSKVISDSSFMRKVIVNGDYEVDDYEVHLSFKRDKYFEIDPYTDLDYYLYINIPNKLADQFDNAVFELGFNDDMESPKKVYNSDGSTTIEVDNIFSISASAAELGTGKIGGSAPNSSKEASVAAESVAVSDNIKTKYWDITLAKAEVATAIFPVEGEGMGYESGDGYKFINLEFDIKNLDTEIRAFCDAISNVVVHCGKYNYDGYSMYYDMGGSLSVTLLKGTTHGPSPLDPTHLYVETIVSDDAIDAGDITVDLTIAGKPYMIAIEK